MVKGISFSPLLLLLAFFFLSFSFSGAAEPINNNSHPQKLRSFKIQETQVRQGTARGCSYTVSIETSCSSSRITRDSISLAFGDAYRNEVYAARLDDPSGGIFDKCSTDTFKIQGPCGYGICYLYLRRSGRDGWIPEWVKVYEPNTNKPITFYYGTALPNSVWFGFNNCRRLLISSSSSSSSAQAQPTTGDLISQM